MKLANKISIMQLVLALLVFGLMALPSVAYAATPPQVFFIAPSTGPLSGGTTITIVGNNFKPGAYVVIGGFQATGVQVGACSPQPSGGQNCGVITAVTPPGTLRRSTSVVVVNPNGLGVHVPNGFTYY